MIAARQRSQVESEPQGGTGERRETRTTSSRDLLLLCVLLLIGAAVRLDFMRAGDFVIDGDEAIVGLMAKHITEGQGIPTFYYGQHYMGSLEALCAAGLFLLFGASPFTLQLTPLLFSLALIVVMHRLGREVAGLVVGRVAAALTAIPPVALVVWSYKARGGFIELLVIVALATLFALKWLKRPPGSFRYSFLTWLLLGIGWWVNNQVIYFMVPIAVVGALHLLSARRKGVVSSAGLVGVSVASGLAFLLGSAPYWVYNIRNGFPSLGMFGFASPSSVGQYFFGLWNTALPIILGAKDFWASDPSIGVRTILVYAVYVVVLGTVIVARRRAIARLVRGGVERESQVELFFIVMAFACGVFTVSTFGWLSQAPRYLLPLYIPLFIVSGLFVQVVSTFSRTLALGALALLVGLNLTSCYLGGRSLPGEPVVYRGERVSRSHAELIETLDDLGISKVRTNYWIGYRLAFETNERVTFLVLQEPRQVRLPSYQELPSGAQGDLVPLLMVPGERSLFVGALEWLGYSFEEKRVSGYVLVFNIKRPPLNLVPLSAERIASVRGSGARDAIAAVDQANDTRWGTGMPQSSGQEFVVSFKGPVQLAGFKYLLGSWSEDYPRGLRVSLEDNDGQRETVLSEADYPKLAAFFKGSDLEVWFAPRVVRRVIFEQTGSHPVFDWSIAEIRFYQQAIGGSASAGGARE